MNDITMIVIMLNGNAMMMIARNDMGIALNSSQVLLFKNLLVLLPLRLLIFLHFVMDPGIAYHVQKM